MREAFVTGGSGFLGRNLIEALRTKGIGVRAIARSDAAARTVSSLGAVAVRADLGDVAALTEAMRGCDVVFHAAAKVEVWGAPDEFERINVGGTEAILAAARAASVARLVHVSTEAVLVGGGPIHDADETRPLPSRNIGLYPRTKAAAEARVVAANSAALTTVVVRPRFIWGRGDTVLVPKLIEAAQRGAFMWIGGGRYRTSTCHVRNVVEGMLLAAERGKGGEVYFLTDGAPVEFRAFLTQMMATRGVDPGTKSVPRVVAHALALAGDRLWTLLRRWESPPMLPHSVFHLIGEEVTVNDAKARRELGYVGAVTREEGLREMRELAKAGASSREGEPGRERGDSAVSSIRTT